MSLSLLDFFLFNWFLSVLQIFILFFRFYIIFVNSGFLGKLNYRLLKLRLISFLNLTCLFESKLPSSLVHVLILPSHCIYKIFDFKYHISHFVTFELHLTYPLNKYNNKHRFVYCRPASVLMRNISS